MNGTDFIPKLLERFAGRRVALWGTAEPFLGLAADAVRTRFAPTSLDLQNGFLSAHQYAEMAVATQPELIVLGMGMPKQEAVATRLRAQQGAAVIACGGAILDFLGGRFPRAPQWMRRLGIEWLFRLAREPRRLFQRYVIGNPLFMIRCLRWKS